MRVKAAFIAGAGIGYVLGTRAGRQQFEKLQGWSKSVWQDPRVQQQVTDLEEKASEIAKTEGAALKDKVTGAVKSVVESVKDKDKSSVQAEEKYPVDYRATADYSDPIIDGSSNPT